jgi:hypothetical protein
MTGGGKGSNLAGRAKFEGESAVSAEKRKIEVRDHETWQWVKVKGVESVRAGDTFRTFEPNGMPVVIMAVAARDGFIESDGVGVIEFDMPPGILA